MYCYKCGVKNNKESEFCIGCGVKLLNVEKKEAEIKKSKTNISNYLGISIILVVVNCLFCCIIMGFIPLAASIIALVNSIQVDVKIKDMDLLGAEDNSKNAKLWIKITIGLTILFVVLTMVLMIILMAYEIDMSILGEYINEYQNYMNERNQY